MTPEQLFEENKNFAYYIVNKFMKMGERDDLQQQALLGLHLATTRYDASKDIAFTTYAFHYIRKEVLRYIEKNFTPYHVSRPVRETMVAIRRLKLDVLDVDNIVKLTGMRRSKIERAVYAMCLSTVSVDAPITYSDNEATLMEMIDTGERVDYEGMLELKQFMSTLRERDRGILEMRLQDKSQPEIGRAFGISQVQVSRVLKKIRVQYEQYMAVAA